MTNTAAAEKLMAEVSFNIEALVQYALQNVVQPPRGTIKEVGHYFTLNKKLRRDKELEALQQLLDELAYNVTATLFATLDGDIQSDIPDFPVLVLLDKNTDQPIAEGLHQAFMETSM